MRARQQQVLVSAADILQVRVAAHRERQRRRDRDRHLRRFKNQRQSKTSSKLFTQEQPISISLHK